MITGHLTITVNDSGMLFIFDKAGAAVLYFTTWKTIKCRKNRSETTIMNRLDSSKNVFSENL